LRVYDRMKTSLQQKALVSLMCASGRIRRQFGDVVGEHGLGSSQYNILRILRGAGGALPIMTIRARMIDPEPSITRLVDRLEERGLIRRVPSSEDRRRVECQLTVEGREMVDALDKPVDDRDRDLMSRLNRKDIEALIDLLDRVGLPE